MTDNAVNKTELSFSEIRNLIEHSRRETLKIVNSALVELYWNIGK